MLRLLALSSALVLLFALSGCTATSPPPAGETDPVVSCIQACRQARDSGTSLEPGPCLLNPILAAPQWVCDVAHEPRQAVDDLPENQCSAYRRNSTHFVELRPDCSLIRVY
ncbi:Uncharacterised protein [uncultured archaeon]|nr:Uncharacterised protein [uncultured archaeon]